VCVAIDETNVPAGWRPSKLKTTEFPFQEDE